MRTGGNSRPCAAMSTVSDAAARNSHLKKLAKASLASRPLKRDCGVAGCTHRKPALRASATRVAAVSRATRAGLFLQKRSSTKTPMLPKVRQSSGRNQPAERRFSAMRCAWSSMWGRPPLQGLDRPDQAVQRRVDPVEDGLALEAQHHHQRSQRVEREALAPVEVREAAVGLVG